MLSDLLKQENLDPNRTNPSNRWARWSDVRRDHLHDFPDSLAAAFVRRTSDHPMSAEAKLAVLHKLVAARWRTREPQYPLPRPTTPDYLLVHLRVGDVIEEEEHSLHEMLYSDVAFNLTGTRYVRRLHWYKSLDVSRMNVSRALLVAGSHLPYASFNRSCVYIHEVRKVLQQKGLQVDLRCGRDADEDVVAASRARWVAASSGGFSSLLLNVARSFGGKEAPRYNTGSTGSKQKARASAAGGKSR